MTKPAEEMTLAQFLIRQVHAVVGVAIEARGDPAEVEAAIFPTLAREFAYRANLAKLTLQNREALAAQRARKKTAKRRE
jgi:hypothetical protein